MASPPRPPVPPFIFGNTPGRLQRDTLLGGAGRTRAEVEDDAQAAFENLVMRIGFAAAKEFWKSVPAAREAAMRGAPKRGRKRTEEADPDVVRVLRKVLDISRPYRESAVPKHKRYGGFAALARYLRNELNPGGTVGKRLNMLTPAALEAALGRLERAIKEERKRLKARPTFPSLLGGNQED